ncbi:acetyl-CoA carboxylase biotin carboxylase subunit [Achromobacter aloeverae]|uniref:Biotin carboxylase n=1 Tax=Achromobacter aloeverae TaxID=1750518 RepID=A0A4Q1HFB5_9BURK|nr:biotin carboxylase N-terminal domain-containing protein [Achromobacter aloeverae]RXN85385.1 biotin carboxylase [Achromobacter aloeverae]
MPFNKILIANRGAIAARVLRTARAMGLRTVCVYSEADRTLPYLAQADETHCIGEAAPAGSYLNQEALLDVLRKSGADAVHPGYGFLSESASFAQAVQDAGACFVGPAPRWLDAMGHKTRARELMAAHGMPMGAASPVLAGTPAEQLRAVERVGFPVLIKPAGGGGGIGMIPVADAAGLPAALERAASLSARSFGQTELYAEKLVSRPRHIEFQILADRHGAVQHIYERDCSVQRRHQKVIEESPAPGLARDAIATLGGRIAAILAELGYDVIGTVEMLYGDGHFGFLEMNTRLQVEHAVTEMVCDIDLVRAQIRLAAGDRLRDVLPQAPTPRGHAIEARVYAEDPVRFLPSPGTLARYAPPEGEGIRVETGYAEGSTVTPFYDPLLAKVIAHGADRGEAIDRLRSALSRFEIAGVKNNIPFIQAVLRHPAFLAGDVHTGMAAEVLAGK